MLRSNNDEDRNLYPIWKKHSTTKSTHYSRLVCRIKFLNFGGLEWGSPVEAARASSSQSKTGCEINEYIITLSRITMGVRLLDISSFQRVLLHMEEHQNHNNTKTVQITQMQDTTIWQSMKDVTHKLPILIHGSVWYIVLLNISALWNFRLVH